MARAFYSAIEEQTLRAGALLSSVRRLAEQHALSTFTVTEAYGRLVSMGLVTARRGSGYCVAVRAHGERSRAVDWQPPSLTVTWLLSDVFADHSVPIKSGCGWLPNENGSTKAAFSMRCARSGACRRRGLRTMGIRMVLRRCASALPSNSTVTACRSTPHRTCC